MYAFYAVVGYFRSSGYFALQPYVSFLEIAFGSLNELHYQFTLSKRLGYIKDFDMKNCENQFIETEKVLGALIRSLRRSKPTS